MDFTGLIEGGAANPLILFVMAFVLGALHGLEPGHSKTMIAAFIIAVRGSVGQAVLLGASAAFSHSIIVWVVGLTAVSFGDELIAESIEPYFMVASGAIVLAMATWMGGRLYGERAQLQLMSPPALAHAHAHAHAGAGHHDHGHSHAAHHHDHHDHHHHDHHHHDHPHHDHGHGHHAHDDDASLDPHARAHARELRARLASGGQIGTIQTVLFGLTGGLIPCAAAITVLIICLHLDQIILGIGLVTGFSLGLGVTLVGIGVVAAWGSGFVARRSGVFDRWAGRLPYLSSALIGLVGMAMVAAGLSHFSGH